MWFQMFFPFLKGGLLAKRCICDILGPLKLRFYKAAQHSCIIKQSFLLSSTCHVLQVVIGAGHKVAQHSRISLCQQAETSSSLSDDELEYAAAGSIARGLPVRPSPHAKAMDAQDDASSDSSDDAGTQYQPANGSTLEKPQPEVLAAARAVSDRDDRQQGLHLPNNDLSTLHF